MIKLNYQNEYLLDALNRAIGGGGTAIFVALLIAPPPTNFFFTLEIVAGVALAVPYFACFFNMFRGGFTICVSTYASLVDLTGTDLSIDCLMLAVSVFSFASLSSKQRCVML